PARSAAATVCRASLTSLASNRATLQPDSSPPRADGASDASVGRVPWHPPWKTLLERLLISAPSSTLRRVDRSHSGRSPCGRARRGPLPAAGPDPTTARLAR